MKREFFTFEQLGGEYAAFSENLGRSMPTAVFGVHDCLKYLYAALIDAPVVYITADGTSAKKAAARR